MKIVSIKRLNDHKFVARVTGLVATSISIYTEVSGIGYYNVFAGSSSTGPGSKYAKSYTRERNAKMLKAFEDAINAGEYTNR